MKILWLTNNALLNHEIRASGGWLDAMAEDLLKTGSIQLSNISFGYVNDVVKTDNQRIEQWLIPSNERIVSLSHFRCLNDIIQIVNTLSPDMIHVWGTEFMWGLFSVQIFKNIPALLEMQGLCSEIAKVYGGGLTLYEKMQCIGLKELIKGETIFQLSNAYERWGKTEKEIIKGHKYITVQTEWIRNLVQEINPHAVLFNNSRILRGPFYQAGKWKRPDNPIIYCPVSTPVPYKGLHVAVRILKKLKQKHPKSKLKISGMLDFKGIHRYGYIHWLKKEISRSGLEDNVDWMGALNADQIVKVMLESSAALIPGFIENCSNTLQEAMRVGLPVVASEVGGLPSLAKDGESILFYNAGDTDKGARKLENIITDDKLALRISTNAKKRAIQRNNRDSIIKKQIAIYKSILLKEKK